MMSTTHHCMGRERVKLQNVVVLSFQNILIITVELYNAYGQMVHSHK